mgnify:CR=1 FL=1
MSKKLKIIIILVIVAIVIGVLIYANNKKKSAAKLAASTPPRSLKDRIKSGEFKVKEVKMANKDIIKNVVPLEDAAV